MCAQKTRCHFLSFRMAWFQSAYKECQLWLRTHCLFISAAVIRHSDKKKKMTYMGKGLLACLSEKSRQELEAISPILSQEQRKNKCLALSPLSTLRWSSIPCLGNSATRCGLGLPISIHTIKRTPQRHAHRLTWFRNFSLRLSFQVNIHCVELKIRIITIKEVYLLLIGIQNGSHAGRIWSFYWLKSTYLWHTDCDIYIHIYFENFHLVRFLYTYMIFFFWGKASCIPG